MKKTRFLVALGLVMLPAASFATVTVTHSYVLNPAGSTFTVSSTDLINNGQPTVVGVTTDYVSHNGTYGAASVLTDGIATGDDTTRVLPQNLQSFTITYDLSTVVSPTGYTINSIQTFAGNSDGRARQEYQVFYSLVGDPSYIQLIPDNYTTDRPTQPFQTNSSTNPGAVDGGSGGETALTISIGGLTNVDSIRFVTSVPSGNSQASGASVYREFDVIGTATVPEASVTALFGAFGLFGILRRRR